MIIRVRLVLKRAGLVNGLNPGVTASLSHVIIWVIIVLRRTVGGDEDGNENVTTKHESCYLSFFLIISVAQIN